MTQVNSAGTEKDEWKDSTVASRHAKLTCYNCKQLGHIKPNCPQKESSNRMVEVVEEVDMLDYQVDLAMMMFHLSDV
jgi:hypothetical protein